MLFRQVRADRRRLAQTKAAVFEDRDLGERVLGEKVRRARLAFGEANGDGLERNVELAKRPVALHPAGRARAVQLDHAITSFITRTSRCRGAPGALRRAEAP